jgi:hypothetical protein
MNAPTNDEPSGSPHSWVRDFCNASERFFVGCFAGGLASFFPRLMAILGGDPTKHIEPFSSEYLIVGTIVAVAVGLVVLIVESRPGRKLRDVFMTALGIPTLLMGALSTTATTGNIASLQHDLEQATDKLRSQAGVPLGGQDSSVPALERQSAWQMPGLIIGPAYAAGPEARPVRQNSLGITARQRSYVLVYHSAPNASALRPLQRTLEEKGIKSRIVAGSKGDSLLVPADTVLKPYDQAVQDAVAAKDAGAKPYIVPVQPDN